MFEYISDRMIIIPSMQIYEGSSIYASSIANKLIEVVDRQYAAAPPISSNCL